MKLSRFTIAVALACSLTLSGCATTGTTPVSSAATSALSVARSGIDAAAHAFDAALYGLDVAMDFKLITPGSDQAKNIAQIGRNVQAALNKADAAYNAGNSAEVKAALEQADSLIQQFRALLPASHTTGMTSPRLDPQARTQILVRAAA